MEEITSRGLITRKEMPSEVEIALEADRVIEGTLDSGDDPLKLIAAIRCMKKLCDDILADRRLFEAGEKELSHYPDATRSGAKIAELYGVKFKYCETGVRYDYTVCGDRILDDLYAQKAILDAKIKERERQLRYTPEGGSTVVDEETGEIYTVYPPLRTASDNIVVSLKKD